MKKGDYVRCNICNSNDTRSLFKKNSFKVVKCNKCGLVYVNPRLDYRVLKKMYNLNTISPFDYYLLNMKNDEKSFNLRLKYVEQYKKPGKLLDLGCGIGVLLSQAKRRGWDEYGLDVKKGSITYAKKHYNVKAFEGTLENHKFKENFFDVIVMNDFLEHVPNPLDALKEARRLLKKDGLLFIATPNIDSVMAKISKTYWLHLKPDEHIYYFSPKTIKILLEKAGFRTIKQRSFGRIRSLDIILLKMQTYTALFYKIASALRLNKLLSKISFYIDPGDEMGVLARKA